MELKPCPLCKENVAFQPYKNNGLKIQCRQCGISYQQRTLRYGLDWLEAKMTETWNRRACDRNAALEEAIRVTAQSKTTSHACDAIRSLKTKEGE